MKIQATDEYITFMTSGKQVTVYKDDTGYEEVLEAVKAKNEQFLVDFAENKLNIVKPLFEKIFGENVVVNEEGQVLVDGREIPKTLSDRIMSHKDKGLPLDGLVNFVVKVRKNPSSRSQLELFDFLDAKNLPIDDDGDFYAYKAVQSDYFSKRKGTIKLVKGVEKEGKIYNAPGEYIECERNEVDDDRTNECSHGLHVGRLEYATRSYYKVGDKVVIVKVNPKNVVSVPKDYSCSKLRTCSYYVVEDYTGPLPDYTLDESDYEYDDEYDDDYWDEEDRVCCGGACVSPCTSVPSVPSEIRKGNTVSFTSFGFDFNDVLIGKVQDSRFYGINDDGFGSWDVSEIENLVVN